MSWNKVGEWLSANAGSGVALVGSLLTGNVPGAIAAGAALVASATGSSDPSTALAALQHDPATLVRLRELAQQEQQQIREHLRATMELELRDGQHRHEQTQLTIRGGDQSDDEYVKRTRPLMARQSWYATIAYIVLFEAARASKLTEVGAEEWLAMILSTPAWAYLGLRTADKFSSWRAARAAR